MLYAESPAIAGLGYVVMDEVHYLADRFRGAVWEEVIIHLPQSVTLVSLSATVSNAEEFGDWLVTVRGAHEGRRQRGAARSRCGSTCWSATGCSTCSRCARPRTPASTATPRASCPPASAAPPSSTPSWSATSASTSGGSTAGTAAGRGSRRRVARTGRGTGRRRAPTSSSRLDNAGLLPAITFVFSRNGCDAAVHQCLLSRAAAHRRGGARRDRRDHRPSAPARCPRRTCTSSASGSGARACSPGSPPTTPGWCPRSRRPSRSASSAAWSRRCSPPRPSRWASTCRRAPSSSSGW